MTSIYVLGDIDSPLSPDQKGFTSMSRFLSGVTDQDRQMWRDEILSTSAVDFKEFSEKLASLKDTGSVVVFGSETALEDANSKIESPQYKLKLVHAFPKPDAEEK